MSEELKRYEAIVRQKLNIKPNKPIWKHPTKKTWAIFYRKKQLDFDSCYDEHDNGHSVLMCPLSFILEDKPEEILIPEYYAKAFLNNGLVREFKEMLIAPISYDENVGLLLGASLERYLKENKDNIDFI